MTALALQRKDDILQSLERGELMKNIAANLGITPGAISHALANDPSYQAARESGIGTQLDTWQERLESAEDQFNLARAREVFKAVSWRASVEMPHRWGAKQQMQVDHRLTVDDRLTASLDRLIGRVVEGQHTIVSEPDEAGTGVMSNDPSNQDVAPTQQIDTLQALVPE